MRWPLRGALVPDTGSALLLVPAGLLILVVLAGLAVDAAIAYMARREVASIASGAANEAVIAALQSEAFYREDGTLRIDDEDVRAIAAQAVGDAGPVEAVLVDEGTGCTEGVVDDRIAVTVEVAGTVELVFTPALGERPTHETHASSTAVADPSDLGPFSATCGR
ncbi:hypothetical protein [Egibacter rhizosphaerae]|uniref:hypothetical protein n=1 Tax=Egibacter rhizosphaerae TaxID=1670831 RepID=UPI0013F14BC3|nr:hypothetical protein [Egibacter rhizosphaerae]